MLDKNPNHVLNEVFVKLKMEFSDKNPIIVLSSKPYVKSEFLKRLIDSFNVPVIFFDFDLLYSGYINSGMIKKNANVKILRSDEKDFQKNLKEVIEKISKDQVLVILDSLNVLYNMFENLDSFRFINATIMLLASIAKTTKSYILVTSMVTKNEKKEWILSPGGKHLINSTKSGMYYLDISELNLILNSVNKKRENDNSFIIKN